MLENEHAPRVPRAMVERWFPGMPYIGTMMNRSGSIIGDPVNCAKMLRNEEAVMIFPEGVDGIGKSFKKRYQLQRFGRSFMHLAMEEKTPIVPVGIVGCEEIMPSLGNIAPLAKLLDVPYVSIAPPIPLPTKVLIGFGKPMVFSGSIENQEQVQANVDQVKGAIDDLIEQGLSKRKNWFY